MHHISDIAIVAPDDRSLKKETIMNLKQFIATVPDFPKPGILFRDMSPLLASSAAFKESIKRMKELSENKGVTKIGAFDARGFIFAGALAHEMNLPFFMLRKKGKLPGKTASVAYGLEYGKEVIEIAHDAVNKEDIVLLIDDVLATGGTAKAGAELIESFGAKVALLVTLIELTPLGGRAVFNRPVEALIAYSEHDAE